MEVAVVVLGDVGRSPRMQYHAKSIVDMHDGTHVSLIGYKGERCVPDVQGHPRISQCLFSPYETSLPRSLFVVYAPLKVLVLVWRLAYALLFRIPRPDFILVQNPPSIPALLVVWVAARLHGSQMVIDWHNFGFTVLSQSKGKAHPFVRISKLYEAFFAGCADAHFSVTEAMQKWIKSNWGVEPVVLYDKAPHFFHTTDADERHTLFAKLEPQLKSAISAVNWAEGADSAAAALARSGGSTGKESSTLFTTKVEGSGKAGLRPDRPALVVSSTSWTEDEDFGLLLKAIEILDERVRTDANFPFVVFVVTGKGPLKQMYEAKMAQLHLEKTHVCTMWLEPQDYPLLLGSADLGVCLHTSTSGLDLPMKVVDMYGCGLPVCAVGFDCLNELVRHDENGMVFSMSTELADQMEALLKGVTSSTGNSKLNKLRQGVAGFERWDTNWKRNAAPVFSSKSRGSSSSARVAAAVVLLLLVGLFLVMFLVSARVATTGLTTVVPVLLAGCVVTVVLALAGAFIWFR